VGVYSARYRGSPVKAMILAAGKSTRLGRLGAEVPKPMLPLCGRPVLEWTIERLRDSGITELVINLHHAPEVILRHFGDGSSHGVRIHYTREEKILGTAGALRNARHVLGENTLLVIYGDTVLDWDVGSMVVDHLRYHRPAATIVVAEVEDPSRLGVVSFDQDRSIHRFIEKPGLRPELGYWVSAGACVLEPLVFEHIPAGEFSDLGAHLFPSLLECGFPLRAYPRPRPLLMIDTPQQYAAAQQYWRPPLTYASDACMARVSL
jgi:NDP-sugar pyrophosphorylase family protein